MTFQEAMAQAASTINASLNQYDTISAAEYCALSDDERECLSDQEVVFLDPDTGMPVWLGWVDEMGSDTEAFTIWTFDRHCNETIWGHCNGDFQFHIVG